MSLQSKSGYPSYFNYIYLPLRKVESFNNQADSSINFDQADSSINFDQADSSINFDQADSSKL